MENQKARKNIYMSKEVANWYEEEAIRLGVSQSNLMTIVLSQYISQQKALDMGDTFKQLLKISEENPQK